MESIEDIPHLYPAPFWAAYGALEGGGVRHAQVRADVAERIVAALVAVVEPFVVPATGEVTVRSDNVAILTVARDIGQRYVREPWWRATDPAVYAAARVLGRG